jgi:transcriptional regulator with XRE-family HTH domain
MSFGARLTAARKRKGLTQEQLGKGLGTDGKDAGKAVVYGWEKDQHMPRVDQLTLMCERLDESADHLLFGTPSRADFPPGLVELMNSVAALPAKQRELVLLQMKTSLQLGQETLGPNGSPGKGERSEQEPISSPVRRKST